MDRISKKSVVANKNLIFFTFKLKFHKFPKYPNGENRKIDQITYKI